MYFTVAFVVQGTVYIFMPVQHLLSYQAFLHNYLTWFTSYVLIKINAASTAIDNLGDVGSGFFFCFTFSLSLRVTQYFRMPTGKGTAYGWGLSSYWE